MGWNDVVELIAVSHSKGSPTDVSETSREVYANKKNVQRSEFYQAYANGLRVTAIYEVHSFEYEDEQKLRHDGHDYLIIRTYGTGNEFVDLICKDYDDIGVNLARLRHQVEIWHNVPIKNSMGENSVRPELLVAVQAEIEYKSGGTGIVDDVVESTKSASVIIAYREGITEDMFLKIGGQRYEIEWIDDVFNRHETLALHVERVIP